MRGLNVHAAEALVRSVAESEQQLSEAEDLCDALYRVALEGESDAVVTLAIQLLQVRLMRDIGEHGVIIRDAPTGPIDVT